MRRFISILLFVILAICSSTALARGNEPLKVSLTPPQQALVLKSKGKRVSMQLTDAQFNIIKRRFPELARKTAILSVPRDLPGGGVVAAVVTALDEMRQALMNACGG